LRQSQARIAEDRLGEHNLLLVELKFDEIADDQKVMEFTRPPEGSRKFQYRYGLALSFFPQLKLRWYENGEAIA